MQTISLSSPAPYITEIRLNRPDSLNAVDDLVISELTATLKETAKDDTARAIILSGEGRAFCAGADYKRHATRALSARPAYLRGLFGIYHELHFHPKPIIAAIHGFTIGMGAEMAVNCDFILAAEGTQIQFPEIAIGTFVGGSMTNLLPRLVGITKAREMLMMCERVSGRDAVSIGLANKCFPAESFREDVLEFAKALAAKAPISVALAKRSINTAIHESYDTSFQFENQGVLTCMQSADWHEGVRAFAEKRAPTFKGG
jgi:enoyl-CoA hydratase